VSIVADRIGKLVQVNKLLVGKQFGFRKSVATEDAILRRTNEILYALNNKTMAGSIFLRSGESFRLS
jgi:hypothetical protein